MIANGLDLIEAKSRVGHGAFTKWVEGCLGVAARRAREYMQIADAFKTAPSADLEKLQKKAMLFLSSNSVSDETRKEALDIAASGETVTLKMSKAMFPLIVEIAPMRYSAKILAIYLGAAQVNAAIQDNFVNIS